jgi:hypothetical protein
LVFGKENVVDDGGDVNSSKKRRFLSSKWIFGKAACEFYISLT